jgi:hypothetical protein
MNTENTLPERRGGWGGLGAGDRGTANGNRTIEQVNLRVDLKAEYYYKV